MEQWRRDTRGSFIVTWFVRSRPMMVSISRSGMVVPLRGPAIATSLGSIRRFILPENIRKLPETFPRGLRAGRDQDHSRVTADSLVDAVGFEEPVQNRSLQVVDPVDLLSPLPF